MFNTSVDIDRKASNETHKTDGAFFLGKSKSGFLYPKTDFAFLYLNPKMD